MIRSKFLDALFSDKPLLFYMNVVFFICQWNISKYAAEIH